MESKCKKCGTELVAEDRFCTECGYDKMWYRNYLVWKFVSKIVTQYIKTEKVWYKNWRILAIVVVPVVITSLIIHHDVTSRFKDFKYIVENDGVIITRYNKKSDIKDVVIPETIRLRPVVAIGNEAFKSRQLTSVTIPNSIKAIGDSAFIHNQLSSVIVPDFVETIGVGAFRDNQLTSITIPNSIKIIGIGAFAENQLSSIIIPDSVEIINDWVFADNQLTSIVIPDSVKKIGSGSFAENQLTSITISDSLRSIGDHTFENNQLTSIVIPDSLTSIGNHAFKNNQLYSVIFANLYGKDIGNNAFENNKLTSITIPFSPIITIIGDNAFANNPLTEFFYYPDKIKMGNNVFAGTPIGRTQEQRAQERVQDAKQRRHSQVIGDYVRRSGEREARKNRR